MSRTKIAGCLTLVSYLSCSLAAQAAIVQYTDTADDMDVEASTGVGVFAMTVTGSVTLPQFNPAMGTLTGVSLSETFTGWAEDTAYTVTNTSTSETATFTARPRQMFSLDPLPNNFWGINGTAVDFPPDPVLAPAASVSLGIVFPFPSRGPNSPPDNTPYIGVGFLTTNLSITEQLTLSNLSGLGNPADLSVTGAIAYDWSRTVTYTFIPRDGEPVPEPALGALALLLAGVCGRRRSGEPVRR